MPPLIQLENVSFSYPSSVAEGQPALANIDLGIQAGESIALIGANGSGKSTLAKLLNALLIPDCGHVLINGLDTHDRRHHTQIRSQVGLVFQRPQEQIVATTVEEDVAFGPANLGLDSKILRERVQAALESTELSNFRQRPTYQLSAGESQRLALAGVLAMQPDCLIFDETTAMLDPLGRQMVLDQIDGLRQRGLTTILITHLMAEAAQMERVIVLHNGQVRMDASPGQVFSQASALQEMGLDLPPAAKARQALSVFFPTIPEGVFLSAELMHSLPAYEGKSLIPTHASISHPGQAEVIIQVDDLAHAYLKGTPLEQPSLQNVKMKAVRGQAHALIGGTGSGKSTFLQHLNGLIRPQAGRVRVEHFDLTDPGLDLRALRRKVSLAFQQPEEQIFETFVGDEIAYAPRMLGYQGKIKDVVEGAMRSVGLDFDAFRDRPTSNLSGGEKRKVALASMLAIQAGILLLDEPLSGLDPKSARDAGQLFQNLKTEGKTLLISTHQYEELQELLDNVSVLQRGRDVIQGSAQEVFAQTVTLENCGLRAPLAALIAEELRRKGWPISTATSNLPVLCGELDALIWGGAP